MDKNLKVKFLNQLEFIFHKIIFGVIGWLVISWLIKYQQKSISSNTNRLFNAFMSLFPFIIYIWFLFTTNKKSDWNIYDKNTNTIAILIVAATILVLAFTVGSAKIFL